jgi:hypothetical protein
MLTAMKTPLSLLILGFVFLLPISLQAEDIAISSSLLCKLDQGSTPAVYTVKNGKTKSVSFSVTLKRTADAVKKAKQKLARVKTQGKKKAIANARLALTTVSLQLSIDPSLGFNQYFGYIYFTDVTAIAPVGGVVVPEALQIATRAACLDAWDSEPNKAVRILTKRINSGIMVSLNPSGFWIPGDDGRFTSAGFNAEPTAEITAVAGFFWDISYSQRVVLKTIPFEFEGQSLTADCFVGPQVTSTYPGV